MSSAPHIYSRVEFVADLGFGERVIAFVEYNSTGISFGIPQHILINKSTKEDAVQGKPVIDVYERITIHRDGKIVTHLPLAPGQNVPIPWDGIYSPLQSWKEPWSMREELVWDDAYLGFAKNYLTTPKPSTHSTCLKVPVVFTVGRKSSIVRFAVVQPSDSMEQICQVIPLEGQVWVVNGGWPWAVVTMSGTRNPGLTQLMQVGRDYR